MFVLLSLFLTLSAGQQIVLPSPCPLQTVVSGALVKIVCPTKHKAIE